MNRYSIGAHQRHDKDSSYYQKESFSGQGQGVYYRGVYDGVLDYLERDSFEQSADEWNDSFQNVYEKDSLYQHAYGKHEYYQNTQSQNTIGKQSDFQNGENQDAYRQNSYGKHGYSRESFAVDSYSQGGYQRNLSTNNSYGDNRFAGVSVDRTQLMTPQVKAQSQFSQGDNSGYPPLGQSISQVTNYPQSSLQKESVAKAEGELSKLSRLKGCLFSVVETVLFIALVLGIGIALRTFVIEPYIIPSSSMEETLMIEDRLFAEKVSYHFHDITPGDIVIFEDPELSGRTLIKRCIAVGGQTVSVNAADGLVYVDGKPLSESYTLGKPSYPLQNPNGITYPYTIPEGYIWVMGDNRSNSQDSRYFGPIKDSTVKGRAALVFWPFEHWKVL